MTTPGGPAPLDQSAPVTLSAWAVEDADLEALGMDSVNPSPTELMDFCRAALGALAVRVEEVTLVIAGDFIKSVKSRLPAGAYRDAFDVDRGAGTVGAKTMRVGGEIHVIFPAWLFLDSTWARATLSPEEAERITSTAESRAGQVRRTVVHEAQHVAMDQAGEDNQDFGNVPWVRQNFLVVAHQVIAEYRAELGVPNNLRESYEADFPVESLDHLREDLRRITTVEYQSHLNVERLAYDVVQQSHHAWKMLAYVAAARRIAGVGIGEPFPTEMTRTEAWTLMAEPHWGAFEELLSRIPSGGVRVAAADLSAWTAELADLLVAWLQTYGFVWRDVGADSEFLIESWELFV
ncbi:hypothetical protein [Microbacterium testaceum]|uniref:hypothetical protein n=1 Tax=Microbacterium testaceum TaxID=2033 RepID=UPI002AC58208|nr:hypothetical protein [Microbacterium testaceum]MDZ5146297.1 hypothetical protein [Microbacterium testaceum]